jgi:hypothetical protein
MLHTEVTSCVLGDQGSIPASKYGITERVDLIVSVYRYCVCMCMCMCVCVCVYIYIYIRGTVDLRLRPGGHQNRHIYIYAGIAGWNPARGHGCLL